SMRYLLHPTPLERPLCLPDDYTCTAALPTTSSSISDARVVPFLSAFPIASSSHGCLSGRGERRARPLPAHTSVQATLVLGRFMSSSSESESGRPTSPPISSRHVEASTSGMSKWIRR